jgi:hypothetical protein
VYEIRMGRYGRSSKTHVYMYAIIKRTKFSGMISKGVVGSEDDFMKEEDTGNI